MTASSQTTFLDELYARRTEQRALISLHHTFDAIHVAGTNGKGSVSLKIAKALEASGLRVGLFTSPHILEFEERIQINGEKIPRTVAEEMGRRFMEQYPNAHFFALTVLIAFAYFEERGVDAAVIEVGMGGRYDATNGLSPILSVITSIGFDHTHMLGNTLEEIAWEKGGILRPHVPAILGPTAHYFDHGQRVFGPFANYEEENRAIARAALHALPYPLTEEMIAKGLAAIPRARFERKGGFILDVAHNPPAFEKLVERLHGEKVDVIIGMSGDKDWKKCLKIIEPCSRIIYCVQADHPRALPAKELASQTPLGKVVTVGEAIKAAKATTLICGSFYVMEEVIKKLES